MFASHCGLASVVAAGGSSWCGEPVKSSCEKENGIDGKYIGWIIKCLPVKFCTQNTQHWASKNTRVRARIEALRSRCILLIWSMHFVKLCWLRDYLALKESPTLNTKGHSYFWEIESGLWMKWYALGNVYPNGSFNVINWCLRFYLIWGGDFWRFHLKSADLGWISTPNQIKIKSSIEQ